ncbi:hypothetical protein PHYSODRAFT_454285, partial [Phytophthora sojae]
KELRSVCKLFGAKVRSKNGSTDNKMGYVTILVQLARSRRESEEATRDQRSKLLQGSEGQLSTSLASTRKIRHCSFRLLNVLFSERLCDRLGQMDDRFSGIDPGHMVPHDGPKLNQIWKDTSAKYSAAHARATQSGLHESEFYDFCMGQLDALYVSAWLQVRPQAFSAAVGSMPKYCQVDTLE